MESADIAVVQHVTKKSSDELLSKFSDEQDPPKKQQLHIVAKAKRRKRSRTSENPDSPQNCTTSSLLLTPVSRRSALLRRLGISRARGIKNRSLLGTIDKTWRRTVEGASKVFMEKQYNRHKRLISDIA